MHQKIQLLKLLADSQTHPCENLAQLMGVNRAAVHQIVDSLIASGIAVTVLPSDNYQLTHPIELLDRATIEAVMDERSRSLLTDLEILEDVDSTNLHLMRKAKNGAASGYACLAEQQHAGRGRHGKNWVSPFACNIYLSLLWRMSARPLPLSTLSLLMGVAVARALQVIGVTDIALKWPNDVLWRGRKLAGILIEMASETTGQRHAVIGVGLNVAMPAKHAADIDQPWIDVHSILQNKTVHRNRFAGVILQHLLVALDNLQSISPAECLKEWEKFDVLKGQLITLRLHDQICQGVALGVDAKGALLVNHAGIVKRYQYGEVSLARVHAHAAPLVGC